MPGVLFIDEVHMLDIECFSFLNRALENEMAPILVVATNGGIACSSSLHSYTEKDIQRILDITCQLEDFGMSKDANILLTRIEVDTSLGYAICCLGLPEEKGKLVEMEGISRVYKLFWDVKRSTQYLLEYQSQYMFNEMPTGEGDEDGTSAMMA